MSTAAAHRPPDVIARAVARRLRLAHVAGQELASGIFAAPLHLASDRSSAQPANDTGEERAAYDECTSGSYDWTAKDPIRFTGGINLYAYCRNDPVNLVDPTGLDPGEGGASGYDGGAEDGAEGGPGAYGLYGAEAELFEEYRRRYQAWFDTRPDDLRDWGPFSNMTGGPTCNDYADAAADAMGGGVGSAACSQWNWQYPTDQLCTFDYEPPDWTAHKTVRVYSLDDDGYPKELGRFDPWAAFPCARRIARAAIGSQSSRSPSSRS
jgi:hypothetical protein